MKRQRKGGFEMDAFSNKWRHFLCYLQRSGVRKKAKRQCNKRERKEAKLDNYENNV